jgi:hypothetical protein
MDMIAQHLPQQPRAADGRGGCGFAGHGVAYRPWRQRPRPARHHQASPSSARYAGIGPVGDFFALRHPGTARLRPVSRWFQRRPAGRRFRRRRAGYVQHHRTPLALGKAVGRQPVGQNGHHPPRGRWVLVYPTKRGGLRTDCAKASSSQLTSPIAARAARARSRWAVISRLKPSSSRPMPFSA